MSCLRGVCLPAVQPHLEQVLVVAVASCAKRDRAARAKLSRVGVDENRNEAVLFVQFMHVIRDAVNSPLQNAVIFAAVLHYKLRMLSLTAYLGSPVSLVKSRNSSWIVVTSEVLESGPHRGACALPVLRLTSEYGIADFDENAGRRRSPRSICDNFNEPQSDVTYNIVT